MRKNNVHIARILLFSAKNKVYPCVFATMFFLSSSVYAQSDKKIIREANKQYEQTDYSQAESKYRDALQKNKNSDVAAYNLANTLYQKGDYSAAADHFQSLTHKPLSKDTLSKIYHNLGNSFLQQHKYEEAINAYKNALKHNFTDEDTRYNLAYAQHLLKQKKNEKDEKNKKDEKQENSKEKDEKENKKDKDKKDKEGEQQPSENKDEQQQQENQLSKEEAQRLLDALQNEEKNVRNKLKKNTKTGVKVKIEKDW